MLARISRFEAYIRMNIPARCEGLYSHQERSLTAGVLVLTLLLSTCTAPGQPVRDMTNPPAPRRSPFAIQDLQQAADNYNRYYTLVPDDLLGLKHLADVCAALEEVGVGIEDGSCQEAAKRVTGGQGDKGTRRQGEGEIGNSPAALLWTAWLEQVAAVEPEHLVDQELDHGWTFLGYDGDEDRLVRGEPTDLLLYWVGPASANAGSEQDAWYRAGERWVQVLEAVQNLVLNGGFELGVIGFPHDIYRADPGARQLVTDVRTGQRTAVAMLSNTEVYSATSFASLYIPVNPEGLYLQAGWIKSAGGNGYLGRRWIGDLAAGVRPYNYVVTSVKEGDWRHYAGVTRPLNGANRCQIWLINWRAVGRVYFDDVLFVEIGVPGK